ncbi:hypothetical protein [Planctomyces sp. SH-PL62]|uniref:hypothetical protein n=1 Tax=Planctomyces sp. SH-PL62 TaxID=1636152 RepID=UPI00078D6D46|nr:hypothetical protein [Planctomyces sp. SH-PL62]AMV38108.1 hypothetical protein VT85_11770 [Planctomyces sp. SH-PL62]
MMPTTRRQLRPFLVALLAIAGMVSASACTTKPASASRTCCASRPSSECDCCAPGEMRPSSGVASRADAAIVTPAARAIDQAPSASCECRASEPAAPSERPAQRTSPNHSEIQDLGLSVAVAPALKSSPSLARLLLPNESPPGSPLYLRTSRLLI